MIILAKFQSFFIHSLLLSLCVHNLYYVYTFFSTGDGDMADLYAYCDHHDDDQADDDTT